MPLSNPTTTTVGANGTYVGNAAANRAVPHGLGRIPVLVRLLYRVDQDTWWEGIIMPGTDFLYCVKFDADTVNNDALAVTAIDATNFYVGNAADMNNSMNANAVTYYWSAL